VIQRSENSSIESERLGMSFSLIQIGIASPDAEGRKAPGLSPDVLMLAMVI
jgi:hypothetical protein